MWDDVVAKLRGFKEPDLKKQGLAWEDVPNKITAGDRHDCQIFHVDQSRQRGALVTLLLGEDAWDATATVPMSYCPRLLHPNGRVR